MPTREDRASLSWSSRPFEIRERHLYWIAYHAAELSPTSYTDFRSAPLRHTVEAGTEDGGSSPIKHCKRLIPVEPAGVLHDDD